MSKMNRRNFIEKTAISAAGISIIPRHVLGGNGFIAPSDRIQLGYIGTGKQIYTLLNEIGKCKETVVIAASDVYKSKLTSFIVAANKENQKKDINTSIKSYDRYRELLENKEIDAVVIATPEITGMHKMLWMLLRQEKIFIVKNHWR